jgi:hypothetical protein
MHVRSPRPPPSSVRIGLQARVMDASRPARLPIVSSIQNTNPRRAGEALHGVSTCEPMWTRPPEQIVLANKVSAAMSRRYGVLT